MTGSTIERAPSASIAPDRARPALRIGLLWHSLTSGNLGVGALTEANMAIARQVADDMGLDCHFVVMAMRDGDKLPTSDPSISPYFIDTRVMLRPNGFWREVAELDCVLDIGAGDSFTDIYGPKRFAFLWVTKMMAIARRVPLLFSPQTIGPFSGAAYRRLAAIAMQRSAAVISRDDRSLSIARELAPKARNALAVDVAFVLPFEDQSHLRGGPKLRIGINASGLLFDEAETGRNRFGLDQDYAEFTHRLIAGVMARGDAEVHLVPHATSRFDPRDDDGQLADRLAAAYPGAIRVGNFASASAAKSYISGLDMLVAGRMHACIGAFSSGTPVIPVAYSRKFSGLFGMLGYDEMIPVKGMTTDAAVDFALGAIDRRAELAAKQAAGMAKVTSLLDVYRAELRRLFEMALDRAS